jgi:hypothetical protein
MGHFVITGQKNRAARFRAGGKAWESNPPQPTLRRLPLVLKTRAPTGAHPFPRTILQAGVESTKTAGLQLPAQTVPIAD